MCQGLIASVAGKLLNLSALSYAVPLFSGINVLCRLWDTFLQPYFFTVQEDFIMSMIKVEGLTFAYPKSYDNIFENVTFQIDTDWKLGFVGRNGRGKTTFLNLLLNKYEYGGRIISSVEFDYFPYSVRDKKDLTINVISEVCPLAEEWEIYREPSYLEVECDVLFRAFETLSKGEQTKVLLAALFLNEGHFLLIDEPTNHLDIKAREMVASYLNSKKGFILVSHDRKFLDSCVDHILSINRSNIEVQSGNFSSWMENFERRQANEFAQNERLKKDIKRLKTAALRTGEWSERVEKSKAGAYDKGYVGHKAAKLMKRSKAAEDRQNKAIEKKAELLKNTERADDLKIIPLSYHSDRLLALNNVAVSYGDRIVCDAVTFEVRQGDRIALDGKNGCGKSSILKLIMGEDIDHTGTVSVGSGLVISYVPQDASYLKGTLSEFAYNSTIEESLFKAVLYQLGVEQIQLEKDISGFSDGQKKKVLLARSLCQSANLYVWDEPLNFIDVYTRVQLEKLIEKFSPTMIFVEHDKMFRDNAATKIIEI